MSLWTIAWRSIQRRAVASTLTAFSMALGVALVVAVLLISGVVSESFRSNSALGYNMVVGAKGGRLQLILNTVYYLSQPIENVPYDYYLEFLGADEVRAELTEKQLDELSGMRRRKLSAAERRELDQLSTAEQERRLLTGKFADQTYLAIPIAMGDYYEEYRIVGTSPRLFNDLVYDVDRNRKYEFSQGSNFELHSDEYGYFGAVVGAAVAREQGLKLGDELMPSCGATAVEGGKAHDHDMFRVVGILAPSGTPNDRAVFVNIEGFLMMEGHAKPLDEVAPEYVSEGDDARPQHEHAHPTEKENAPAEDEDTTTAEKHDSHDHESHPDGADGHDHEEHVCDESCPHHGHDHDHETHADEPDESDDHDHEEHVCDESCPHHGHDHEAHAEDAGGDETDSHDHAARGCEEGCTHGHHHEPLSLAQREVTAVLVRNTSDFAAMGMSRSINKDSTAQAVLPVAEITNLLATFVNPLRWLLLAITVMICIVSGIGILVSIYNSMSDRRHEIAVMRALGAGRGTVMAIVLLESLILAVGGGLVGWAAGHGLIGLAGPWIVDRLGVSVSTFDLAPPVVLNLDLVFTVLNLRVSSELLLIPGLILLAVAVGLLPAIAAYRTDVAKSLGSA